MSAAEKWILQLELKTKVNQEVPVLINVSLETNSSQTLLQSVRQVTSHQLNKDSSLKKAANFQCDQVIDFKFETIFWTI